MLFYILIWYCRDNFSWLTGALLSSNEQSYSAYDIQLAHKMWAAPNALSSMLKYYLGTKTLHFLSGFESNNDRFSALLTRPIRSKCLP
jgi:hypothetical protein